MTVTYETVTVKWSSLLLCIQSFGFRFWPVGLPSVLKVLIAFPQFGPQSCFLPHFPSIDHPTISNLKIYSGI
jgi:hypothetical protein